MIKNEQLVDNPHDLLLSLVDIGSIDAVDVLTACVQEMSDAECKRVLSSLCLPEACELEDEEDAQIMPEDPLDISTDDVEEVESPDDGEVVVVDSEEVDVEDEDEDSDSLECRTRRIESRLKKIESILDRRAHSRTLEKRPSRRCTDEDLDDLDDIDDDDLDDFSELEIEDDEDEFDEGCSNRLENRLKRLERTLHNRCERRRCH